MRYEDMRTSEVKEGIVKLQNYIKNMQYKLDLTLQADTEEEVRRQLLEAIQNSNPEIIALIDSLKSPIYIIDVETHPCGDCLVIQDKLDVNEHCDGCSLEQLRNNYELDESAKVTSPQT